MCECVRCASPFGNHKYTNSMHFSIQQHKSKTKDEHICIKYNAFLTIDAVPIRIQFAFGLPTIARTEGETEIPFDVASSFWFCLIVCSSAPSIAAFEYFPRLIGPNSCHTCTHTLALTQTNIHYLHSNRLVQREHEEPNRRNRKQNQNVRKNVCTASHDPNPFKKKTSLNKLPCCI